MPVGGIKRAIYLNIRHLSGIKKRKNKNNCPSFVGSGSCLFIKSAFLIFTPERYSHRRKSSRCSLGLGLSMAILLLV